MPKKKPQEPKVKQFRSKKVANAYVISQYYGFDAIDLPDITKDDTEHAKKVRGKNEYDFDDLHAPEEKVALLRSYKNTNYEHLPPTMLYCEGTAKGSSRRLKPGEKKINLHIIGTPKSTAEAILIKTALCILQEEGFKNISVEINNVGDKDTLPTFLRELTAYYRKHINDMDSDCRQLFKDGPHALVTCGTTLPEGIKSHAPSPFNYLTDENRNHLTEIIEFLDEEEISYDINKDILGHPDYSTDTVFTIIDKDSGKIVATGSRYNDLARRTVHRKGIPAMSVTLKLKKPKQVSLSRTFKGNEIKFFYIHLGYHARLKSFKILEMLRAAKIPVKSSLSQDKLSDQLALAKKLKVPYAIIMGQKEAHDNTVVIRDMQKHSQETVPIRKLVTYLKKLL